MCKNFPKDSEWIFEFN